MRYFALLGILGLFLAGPATAQSQGPFGGPMPPPANRYGPPQGQYGSPRPSQYGPPFQEQLQDIKRSQLGPALGVDQATVERLLAIEQRYRSQKNQVNQGAMEDMQRLQQLMANPNPPEGEVKALLDNMNKRVQASRDLQQRQHEEETAVLTPVQQARYIMYKMQILKEARNVKKGPGPAAPLGPGKAPREVPVFRPSQPQ